MFCTMCCHGVTSVIDGVPTGKVWWCKCGDTNCRHINECGGCKTPRSEGEITYEEKNRREAASQNSS
jgi:hypothetical protein